jgi:hypothetical protein
MSRADIRLCLPLLVLMGFAGCADGVGPASEPRDVIELRWLKAYPRETRADVETGLLWGLSLLGAQLPRGAQVIRWHGERITLDLHRAQVLEASLPAWRRLVAAMKASGEYRTHGALDVGRFLAIALGDSDTYYSLTGASLHYAQARERHRFDPRPAAIVKSAVAHGSRRIDIAIADDAMQMAFVAFEGTGSLADGSFVAREIEVMDMMPNGQLRFALYELDGRLKPAASRELTTAGKPAKCMWCHESGLQPTYLEYPAVSGSYTRREFDALIGQRQELLDRYRKRLATQIDYRERQDHTFAELLYLSFEEPSRERLAREWGVTVERAAELLRGKATHAQEEFRYLGEQLYRRADADALAPYGVLAAPPSVREPGESGHSGARP